MPRSLAAKALAERRQNNGDALSCGQKALRLGVSKALVSLVQNGERPASPEFRAKCLEAYSIPLEDWDKPDPDNAPEAEPAPPPASEKRPARKLGSTREELWATVEDIDVELRGSALSSSQRASLLGKRAGTLSAIARMEKSAALEDHPDFAGHKEDIKAALRETLEAIGADKVQAFDIFRKALVKAEKARLQKAAA